MSSIQEINVLALRISDIVNDYIPPHYNENDVLVIGDHCGKITDIE